MSNMPESQFTHIREIKLTPTEKADMRSRLRAHTILHSAEVAPSRGVRSWRVVRRGALAVGVVVALIAGGTGVSAQWARPGDALYGFKLSVNDRIEAVLTVGDDARIDVEMHQLQRIIDDEDALRDDELSQIAFHAEADSAAYEGDSSDAQAGSDMWGAIDADVFERELQSIERELQEEDRARLELES